MLSVGKGRRAEAAGNGTLSRNARNVPYVSHADQIRCSEWQCPFATVAKDGN